MKLLFQKLCSDKLDWDSQLSPELCQKLQTWIEEMKTLKSFAVPRCYLGGINEEDIKSIELHGFGDASCAAFGAVIFISVETDSVCWSQLVCSKSRVATMTKQSVPRLELLSALTLARLITAVNNALQPVVVIHSVYCWLDSLTAIYWIVQEQKEWKPFVQNRVSKIRTLVNSQFWFHCPIDPKRMLPTLCPEE